jgi:hypothetical protein
MGVLDSQLGRIRLPAVDVQRISPDVLSWDRLREGVPVDSLVTCTVEDLGAARDAAAVLSWRWDRDTAGRSRNIGLALKHAQEIGVRYLFLDLVSIDQKQTRERLLADVVGLANLFSTIPVIAAYDERGATMDEWSRTLSRPWIRSEIRAYCQNPSRVTYVGFLHGPANPRHLRFTNEVSVIRSTGYADTVLDILLGRAKMTNIADFAEILAEFHYVVSACYTQLDHDDYLLAVFLLTALYEKHQAVQHEDKWLDYGFRVDWDDPHFERLDLKRFSVRSSESPTRSYEWAKDICLDGEAVAIWRTKMTSSFNRNWVEILPQAENLIFNAVGLSPAARAAYREGPQMRTAFLRIDKTAPTPAIDERAANLEGGVWRDDLPPPVATTVGFNADLWRRI